MKLKLLHVHSCHRPDLLPCALHMAEELAHETASTLHCKDCSSHTESSYHRIKPLQFTKVGIPSTRMSGFFQKKKDYVWCMSGAGHANECG